MSNTKLCLTIPMSITGVCSYKLAGGSMVIREAHKNAPTRRSGGHAHPGKRWISGLLRAFLMHLGVYRKNFTNYANRSPRARGVTGIATVLK